MATRDIIVIGASHGGIAALQELASALPEDFPAAVFVVQHLGAHSLGLLSRIIGRDTFLPTLVPDDGTAIEGGRIYVAPADRHMLLERGRVRVVRGPKENRHRPAIDPLFRSAAWAYGPRVIGVVLSGELDDGTAGLWAIKTCGGITVVQDPSDAIAQGMPRNAMQHNEIDHCVPLSELAPLLTRLASEQVEINGPPRGPRHLETEVEFAEMHGHMAEMDTLGKVSSYTCPTCRGALWELTSEDMLRYRCHTGHAFSPESLVAEQSTAVEDALYSALRVVEEKAAVLRRLGDEMATPAAGSPLTHYRDRATDLDATAKVIRGLLAGDRS
jgi:two-component system chemotaxis response regulator CheB